MGSPHLVLLRKPIVKRQYLCNAKLPYRRDGGVIVISSRGSRQVNKPVRVDNPGPLTEEDTFAGSCSDSLSGDWHHSPESALRRSTRIPWPWIPGSWTLRRSSITSSVLKTWLKTQSSDRRRRR
jgi:hypothetical protein